MFEMTERIKEIFGLLAMWTGLAMFGYLTPIMERVNNFLHVTEANASAQLTAVGVVASYLIVKILYEFIKQIWNEKQPVSL